MIKTERMIIRKFEEKDLVDLYAYLSDEEVVCFEPYEVYNFEDTKRELVYRMNNECFLAVEYHSKVIGNLYISQEEFDTYEIGYVFNKDYWGKGLACEACSALISETFKTNDCHRIIAMCNPENIRSWHLLERLNFRREGLLRKNIYFKKDQNNNPIWQDTYLYGILKEEWK